MDLNSPPYCLIEYETALNPFTWHQPNIRHCYLGQKGEGEGRERKELKKLKAQKKKYGRKISNETRSIFNRIFKKKKKLIATFRSKKLN